jgi:hypothetical protein
MMWFVFRVSKDGEKVKVVKKVNRVRVVGKIMVMMMVVICMISEVLPGAFYESGKMQPGFGEASNDR